MLLMAGMALITTSCGKQKPQQIAPISVVAETVSNDAAYLASHYVGIVEENTSTPVSFVGSFCPGSRPKDLLRRYGALPSAAGLRGKPLVRSLSGDWGLAAAQLSHGL